MTQSASARITDLCVEITTTLGGNVGATGRAQLANWFSRHVTGGNQSQVDRIAQAKSEPQELHQHERLPPSPRAAAERLCHIMLADIVTRLEDSVSPEVLLPDLDAMRVVLNTHFLTGGALAVELNRLYELCNPVPEPVFATWQRQYRANPTKPWQLVVNYDTHADAHRGLLKAQAACPGGEHRIVGIVA